MKLTLLTAVLLFAASCQHRGHPKMWENMDKNKDEMISKVEFDSAHAEMFKKIDKNSDGKLTKEEMKAFKHSRSHDCDNCKTKDSSPKT